MIDRLSCSILSADFTILGQEVADALAAGCDSVHLDVMDNHYVPNLSFGPLVCASLQKSGVKAPMHVHLMTTSVDDLVPLFAKAGATSIAFHPESSKHVHRSLSLIKQFGCKAGLAFTPTTSIDILRYLDKDVIDGVLIMSVNPGFGGQSFIPSSLAKIARVKEELASLGLSDKVSISVDGGVKADNIASIKKAGADTFIVGSSVFDAPDYAKAVKALKEALLS